MILHIFLNEIEFIFVIMFAARRIVLTISILAHLPDNGDSSSYADLASLMPGQLPRLPAGQQAYFHPYFICISQKN
jgi:hypothetical protein